jgi:hypothetical protein
MFSVLRQQHYIILIPACENLKCHGVLFVLDRMKYICHYDNRGFCSGKYERYCFFFCNVTLFSLAEFSETSEEPFTKNSVNFFHTARRHIRRRKYYYCGLILLFGVVSFLVLRQYFVVMS